MRCVAFLLFLALVAFTAAKTFNSDCKSGSEFKINCNTCTCSEDGKKLTCTEKFCENGLFNMVKMHPYRKSDIEMPHHIEKRHVVKLRVCIPYSMFRRDGEWCLCHCDGSLFSCTRTKQYPKWSTYT